VEEVDEDEETALVTQGSMRGMVNAANDCYMNSFVQALLHTRPFASLLTAAAPSALRVALELQVLLTALQRSKRSDCDPRALKAALGSIWASNAQQDASEFGLYASPLPSRPTSSVTSSPLRSVLFDKLEAAFPEIKDIFGGRFNQSIECLTCHSQSVSREPFLVLTLALPPVETTTRHASCRCCDSPGG